MNKVKYLILPLILFSSLSNAQNLLCNSRIKSNIYKLNNDSITQEIDFRCNDFISSVRYYNLFLNETINFQNAHFYKRFEFMKVTCQSKVNFSQCRFDFKTTYTKVKYNKPISFNQADFHSTVFFNDINFIDKVDFRNADFYKKTQYYGVFFCSDVTFSNTQFHAALLMPKVKFATKVFFNNVDFKESVILQDATFGSLANFSYASFKKRIFLQRLTLPDTLIFSHITDIEEPIDFSYVRTNKKVCYIDLTGTDISKIILRYSQFKLIFTDNNLNYEQKNHIYEQLLSIQKENGFIESYEKLDKEYQAFQSQHKDNIVLYHIRKFLNTWWWDYRYNKIKILFNTFYLLTFFIFTNIFFAPYLNKNVYKIKELGDFFQTNNSQTNNVLKYFFFFINRLFYSFFYSAIIFFGLKLDIEHFDFKYKWSVIYILIQYTIGLICLGYIANYIIIST